MLARLIVAKVQAVHGGARRGACGLRHSAVSAPIWVLAFAQRHLNGSGRLRKAMARSSYMEFMLQGPVLVALVSHARASARLAVTNGLTGVPKLHPALTAGAGWGSPKDPASRGR